MTRRAEVDADGSSSADEGAGAVDRAQHQDAPVVGDERGRLVDALVKNLRAPRASAGSTCRQSSRGRPISSVVSKSTPKSTSSARPGRGGTSGLCSWGSAGQHELLTPVSARALIGAKQPRGATRPSSGAEFWIERRALPWVTTLPRCGRQRCAGEALARQKRRSHSAPRRNNFRSYGDCHAIPNEHN